MTENDLTPEQRAELGDLQPVYERLAAYDAPEPDHDRLLATLKPLLAPPPVVKPGRFGWHDWLRLAWAQTALLEMPFWGASVLLTLLGLALGVGYGGATAALCLFFLSPLHYAQHDVVVPVDQGPAHSSASERADVAGERAADAR